MLMQCLHQGLELSCKVMEGARLECLGVLEAAGEACLQLQVSLTADMTEMGLGSLVMATPAIMLTQVFPQTKAQANMARWDLGMSAGWTAWA